MDSHSNQKDSDGKRTAKVRGKDFSDTNKLDLRNEIQEEYRTHPVAWLVWVFNAIHLPGNSRVLEMGSGTGTLWQENAEAIPKNWKIVLSDNALDMVRKAQANVAAIHPRARFLNLDGQALPFPKESMDAVLAIGLLDLVPDLDQALSEILRVLRPSGQLIATAGGKGHLQELEDLLRPFLPPGLAETLGGDEKHFGIENGEEVLARYFKEVARHDYLDQLVFTSMEPVMDYALSEQAIAWSIPLSKLGDFVKLLKSRLDQHGRLTVTVRKGLFIARKKANRR